MTTEYRNEVSHESSDLLQTVNIQEGQDDLEVGEANISSTAMPTAAAEEEEEEEEEEKKIHAMHHLLIQY